jgi:redox-sensitive bicupin YhaK (pirin superfamily)
MIKQTRQLAEIITGQSNTDGASVKLKRIVSQQQKNRFDPFILLDEFGSDEPTDYVGGFPDHPHRGFETVTYLLEGAMLHRDHLGNEGHLRAGDVQWMTAAHGIIHSEMPEQKDGLLHGFQLWINLPAKEKMKSPYYQEFTADKIPHIDLASGGYLKVIAGNYVTETEQILGPVTGVTTQPLYFDVLLSSQQQFEIPVSIKHTVLVYVYKGEWALDEANKVLKAGQLGKFINGNNLKLITQEQSARFLVLSGLP